MQSYNIFPEYARKKREKATFCVAFSGFGLGLGFLALLRVVLLSADQWKDFLNILPIGSQGVEEIVENSQQNGKMLRNGKIFILRGEKVYTLTGQEVK